MANITDASGTPNALAPPPTPTAGVAKRGLFLVRETIAISFWIYAICKLFIFDIDVATIRYVNPHYLWIAEYKFLLILVTLSIVILVIKNKYLLVGFLYVLFYPTIAVFWRLPRFAFKKGKWLLLFAVINTVISTFRSIKYKFIAFTVFVLSTFVILNFTNQTLLTVSIIGLLGGVAFAYSRMSLLVFRPSSIFQIYSKIIRKCPDFVVNSLSDKEIRNLPVERLSESQIGQRRTSLQTVVIGNRLLLFLSKRLKEYQDSKLNAVAYAFNLVLLLAFTVISYAVISYGLYKLDSQQYALGGPPTFFLFLYYSFHVFLFNGIGEVVPIALYSQMLSMSEQFCAIILLFILIVLFFSVKSEKYKEELTRTIRETEAGGRALNDIIRSNYRMTQAEALEEIRRLQSNFIRLIDWLSRDLE
jgi:hypothetical protein